MKVFVRLQALLFLVLMFVCSAIAQNCDSVQFFSLNHNLIRQMKEHYLISPNKVCVINFTKSKNKFLVSISQDRYSEFGRLFNIEFSTDSILGFFEYDDFQGIILGAMTPLIKKEKIQTQPVWFTEGISKKEHLFVQASGSDIPPCFSKSPLVEYYLINRNARKMSFVNFREFRISMDYYVFPEDEKDSEYIDPHSLDRNN